MSATFTFNTSAFDSMRTALQARLSEGLRLKLAPSAELIVADLLTTWPVDTGASAEAWRDSVADATVERQGLRFSIRLAPKSEYIPHIEYGTSRIPPGGHFQRAMRAARGGLAKELTATVKAAWGGR